ncbi:MAG: class IV adenylate cyclase [Promethearchaeota archaeon]
MIEVEIKARVSNPDELRKKFRVLNGKHKLSLMHNDIYFNMPKGLRDFRNTDEALRIRISTELNNKKKLVEKKVRSFITYKGAKMDEETKTRKELEVDIMDPFTMREILLILGFQEILTVKKKRELYEFEHDDLKIELLLDYLPILDSYFIEVESITSDEKSVEEIKKKLFNFLKLLGIEKQESIKKSYLELILEKITKNKDKIK